MRPQRPATHAAFTLLELLVVMTILATLGLMIASAVCGALAFLDRVTCTSNLRGIGLATQYYLDDHDGRFFPLYADAAGGRTWYFGFEPNGSPALGEGRRILDRTRGCLYPYLETDQRIETCPAVPFGGAYKPKYKDVAWTYGVNYYLSNHAGGGNYHAICGEDRTRTVVFADSAQVNTFQAPASTSNPMAEDWYYLQPGRPQVQFRHGGKANVLFADWHIELVGPAEDSFDPRLPEARIGYFPPDAVLFEPRLGS